MSPLAGILIVAAALRFHELGSQSIWLDEGFSVHFASLDPVRVVHEVIAIDTHPPLYYIALHYWVTLFGDSEAALRSLSAVVGCLTVAVVYRIGRLLADRAVALMAATLVALSSFHIQVSQEARGYSLLGLLTALSFFFFLKVWNEPSARSRLGYLLATVALLYTHLYAVFVILAQTAAFLVASFSSRKSDRPQLTPAKWLQLQAVLAVAFTPWILAVIRQADRVLETEGDFVPRPHLRDLPGTLSGYANSSRIAVAAVAALFAVAVARWLRSQRAIGGSTQTDGRAEPLRSRVLILTVWVLGPLLVPFVASLVLTPFFQFKYTISASLGFYLLVGLSWRYVGGRVASTLVGGLLLGALAFAAVDKGGENENWRSAAAAVNQHASAGDLVLYEAGFSQYPFDYYLRRGDLVEKELSTGRGLRPAQLRRRLRAVATRHRRLWLVHSHSYHSGGVLDDELSRAFSRRSHRSYNGVEIYFFERVSNRPVRRAPG